MKKVFTKALSLLLVAIMLTSTMLVGVSAEEAKAAPVVTVDLTPGVDETSSDATANGRTRLGSISQSDPTYQQTGYLAESPKNLLIFGVLFLLQ